MLAGHLLNVKTAIIEGFMITIVNTVGAFIGGKSKGCTCYEEGDM